MNLPSYGAINIGTNARIVTIECSMSNGLPGTQIIGLPSRAVDEARERIRSAFKASGLRYPAKRVVLSLAPADIPKNDSGLDLSLAVAVLQASEAYDRHPRRLTLGELGLNGDLRPVKGVIGKLLEAQRLGFEEAIIPYANKREAELIKGFRVYLARNLIDCTQRLQGLEIKQARRRPLLTPKRPAYLIDSIVANSQAKRALELALAGQHNLHLYGPPGTGKSMLAKSAQQLLPPLDYGKAMLVAHLRSLASSHDQHNCPAIDTEPPLRAPHHSITRAAMVGGANSAGEIALANSGVLLLDELPEFAPTIIESLRQPLEDGYVAVARSSLRVTYPTRFILLATSNPCPCGYHGSAVESHPCICSGYEIVRYQQRLSGPLMDRLDMHVRVEPRPNAVGIFSSAQVQGQTNNGAKLAENIAHGRRGISALTSPVTSVRPAAFQSPHLSARELTDSRLILPTTSKLLIEATAKLGLSNRSVVKLVNLALTIAVLANKAKIGPDHLSEALQYRWRGFTRVLSSLEPPPIGANGR